MSKSANQLWRESGTSLSFKDWIQREKNKGVEMKNALLEDVVETVNIQGTDTDTNTETDKIQDKGKFDFGIPKWVIFTGVSVIGLAVIYKVIKNSK